MTINIPGTVSVVVFYIIILATGILAAWKTSKSQTNEEVLIANRNLGYFVSIFTLTATMVGGAYINGAAESVAARGLLQTSAPIFYDLALLVASFTFVPKMRNAGYVTMFDPFQLKYGRKLGALLIFPQIVGDLFWSSAIFYALGATLSIILDLNATISIVISAAVACFYTFFGGLYSVAYTDVIQLFFIAIGLTIAFPFAMESPFVELSNLTNTSPEDSWHGTIPTETIPAHIDIILLCVCGGMVWQTYYQRVLACRSVSVAKWSSVAACFFAMALVIPPIMIGLSGKVADWNQTSYDGELPLPPSMYSFMLPLVLHYLTPMPVGIIGVGAVAAAVMSSADSCILASSSVITKNVYQDIFRPKASARELKWVMRSCIITVTVISTCMAIFSTSVYGLFVLCADLMYVIMFPQLTSVIWIPFSNGYGCLAGYFVSLILRFLSGEALLNMPASIHYPLYDAETGTQNFPYRTFAMLSGFLVTVVVSLATKVLFQHGIVPRRFDVFKCSEAKTVTMRSKGGIPKHPDDEEQLAELRIYDKNYD